MELAGCTITPCVFPFKRIHRTPVPLFLQNPAVPGSVFPQGACLV